MNIDMVNLNIFTIKSAEEFVGKIKRGKNIKFISKSVRETLGLF